jgi:hypothetical protein
MRAMSTADAARILGVDVDIKEAALKKHWRKISRKYHPDLHPGDKEAEEKFKELNAAYTTLVRMTEGVRAIHGIEKEILDDEFEGWLRHLSPERREQIRRELAELEAQDEQD